MKGMIYKEITLSRKQAFMTGSIFAMFTVLCILVRLSMEYGNIANDTEWRGHLIDNLWILRYLPLIVLAFSYNPSVTMYDDIDSGFLRFCKTTSYRLNYLIGVKVITLLIFETGVFAVNTLYLALLGAVGGEGITFSSVSVLFKMTVFFCVINLLMLFISTIAKNKKAFEAILVTAVTLLAVAYTPFLMGLMEKYNGRTDIDILDLLRLELAPMLKYVQPLCVVLFVSGVLLNIFVGSKLLERREG